MSNPFRQPYKDFTSARNKLISILVFGLFIFLFLFLFKPFGLSQIETGKQFFLTLGFGFITTFVLLVFNFLLNPVLINIIDGKWTLGKNILLDLLIASSIGAANYFYISIVFRIGFIPKYFLFSIWTAILVGSIPVTISYFVAYNRMYKGALKDAAVPEEKIFWDDEVTIRAGNSKNDFRINPRNIIYFCSNDNYVTIATIKGEIQNKTTIRGTLKAVESELKRNNRFLRCHKCYIVNSEFIEKISGSTQNMKIKLNLPGIEIPVSRSRASAVTRKLKMT
jgi:hypothetical protein